MQGSEDVVNAADATDAMVTRATAAAVAETETADADVIKMK